MDSGLRDRRILVTGASGGIGLAVTRLLRAEGARLALHYHTNPAPLETFRDESQAARTVLCQADLRVEAAADGMVADAVASLGGLDGVVVNAGIWIADAVALHEMSLDQWHATIVADLTSAFLTCRAFLRQLAAQPRDAASIVLVGSTAALFGEADHADYSAAKAGLVYGLTRSLKNEIVRLAPRGRVNCVCPGWTDTPMAAPGMTPAAVARATATMSLQKVATPEDVAGAIVFLLSPVLAGHISGAILPVSGGMEGRLLHLPEER